MEVLLDSSDHRLVEYASLRELMGSAVKDAAMLECVKRGDKVQFTADRVGGVYIVTSIDPVE